MTNNNLYNIYAIWLEQTAFRYLESSFLDKSLENLVDFLNTKGGNFTPTFLEGFGVCKVMKDLQDKIEELE